MEKGAKILAISMLLLLASLLQSDGKRHWERKSYFEISHKNPQRFRRHSQSYCPSSNPANYRLSVSFVLCIDFATLHDSDRDYIFTKVSNFTRQNRDKISLYGVNISSEHSVFDQANGPPGLTCNSRTKLKDCFAEPGGWGDSYIGYRVSVDIQFTCDEEDAVKSLVSRITREINANRLHSHLGYHVIGYSLNLWHCTTIVATSEPKTSTPFVDQSAKPTSMTAAPANYCQLSDISNYYLTISFILCVDYDFLISDDRSRIIRKISNFAIVNISKIAMYRVLVSNQTQFYANVKGPQGLSCSNRKDLDNGLAGAWGWRSAYTGYKASVDIKFNCKDAQEVIDLVTKIKCMITENKLHDHVGFHVIGWALHRWYCVQLTTPSTVLTTDYSSTTNRLDTTLAATTKVPATTDEQTATDVPVATKESSTVMTTKPPTVTIVPENYCQSSDTSNYYLTISFVLGIDYDFLILDEKDHITRRVSNFGNVRVSKIAMYRVLVSNQTQFYANVKGPQGLSCSNRKDLDNGLADAWGWRSVYTGYQTSVDIKFNCKDAQEVIDLVKKIKCLITENKLHDHVGFHVIGWALHRWYCLPLLTTTSAPITSTFPTSKPVTTQEPGSSVTSTLKSTQVTTAPVNYCQVTDSANHRLSISFVLCIDYIFLLSSEKKRIADVVSKFLTVPKSRVRIYRVHVPNEKGVYNSITAPPGFQCSNRTKLDHSLADPGGWRYLYNGYQSSVDVSFTCQDARDVFELVQKIKYEITLNRLHDHVGFHVIGWALHRWHCLAPTTLYTTMTTQSSTTATTVGTTERQTSTSPTTATDEPVTTHGPTTTEEPPTTHGPTTTEEPATTYGPTTTQEPVTTHGTTTTEEPVTTHGPTTTEEPVTTHGPYTTKEPVTTHGPTTTEEPVTTHGPTTTEEPVTTHGPTTTEEPPTTHGPTTTEEPVTTHGPTTTEEPVTTHGPTTTEEPVTTHGPTTTEEPVTTHVPTTTEEPVTTHGPTTTEEPPTTHGPTTTEEPVTTHGPTTTEEPPTTHGPTTTEEPVTTQGPTTTEEPVTTHGPTTTEEPVTTHGPFTTKEPVTTQGLTTTKEPVTTHGPTTTEEPVTTHGPTTTEEPPTTHGPTTTEEPVTTHGPTTTEEPVTTHGPTTTTGPVTTHGPTTTKEPATTSKPTTTEEPVTTAEPATTYGPTTTKEPSTRSIPATTDGSTQRTTPPICEPPIVNVNNISIHVIAGKGFSYQIPAMAFLIPQGGNTRQLSLQLTELSGTFPSKCWYSFDQGSQTISGLSYANLLASQVDSKLVFLLRATRSCRQSIFSVATNLSLNIEKPTRHCLEIKFTFKASSSYTCEWITVKRFAERVAEFYGFSLHQDILIVDFSNVSTNVFSLTLAFGNRQLSCTPCDFKAIANLTERIIAKEDMAIKAEFVSFMSPLFAVTLAQAIAVDPCVSIRTTTTPKATTPRICHPPKVLAGLQPISITVGKRFSFAIPANAFHDSVDGDTRSLSLKLRTLTDGLAQKCWLQLNETAQLVNGLLYSEFSTVGVNMSTATVEITAINSCGLSARTNLTIIAKEHSTHCFEISFTFNTTKSYTCEFVLVNSFTNQVAKYLGFDTQRDISVVKYSKIDSTRNMFAVKIAVLDYQVGCTPCDFVQISSLTNELLLSTGQTVKKRFKTFMSPMFGIANIKTIKLGDCASTPVTPTQKPSCQAPVVLRSMLPVESTAGKSVEFVVPANTFYDKEDGTTRKLHLSLYSLLPNITSKCWYTFNSTSQALTGLPYSALLGKKNILRVNFKLIATDSCLLSVADNLSLILEKPSRHCFEMTISFRTQNTYDCEWIAVKEFVHKLAIYYGFDMERDISVIDYARSKKFYDRFLVKLSFSQKIVKCDHCNPTQINNITYRVLHKENSTVHAEFNSALSPSLEAINVLITGVDACAAYVLPLVHDGKSQIPVLAWLLPVLIFSIALALILLIALCRYCGCCSCCVCIFPIDEEEEFFMRKECLPRRHETYREFIGSDFDQAYPSLRKNRAGFLPTDSSFESTDDFAGSGSEDAAILLPPLQQKGEISGSKIKSNESATVKTFIYARPPFGRQTTEMSIFSSGEGTGGDSGSAVNIMYHDMAETQFQGSDGGGSKQAHGSSDSFIVSIENCNENKVIGPDCSNTADLTVAYDEHSMQQSCIGNPPRAVTAFGMTSQMKDKLEIESNQKSSIGYVGNTGISIIDENGGLSNPAYDADIENLIHESNEDASKLNGSILISGSNHSNGSIGEKVKASFEGGNSTLNGDRGLTIESSSFGGKHAQSHQQTNVPNRGWVSEESSSSKSHENLKVKVNGSRNSSKANTHARRSVTGIENCGLLCDDSVSADGDVIVQGRTDSMGSSGISALTGSTNHSLECPVAVGTDVCGSSTFTEVSSANMTNRAKTNVTIQRNNLEHSNMTFSAAPNIVGATRERNNGDQPMNSVPSHDPLGASLIGENSLVTSSDVNMVSNPNGLNINSQNTGGTYSTSLSFIKPGTIEHSELILGVAGRSRTHRSSYHCDIRGNPKFAIAPSVEANAISGENAPTDNKDRQISHAVTSTPKLQRQNSLRHNEYNMETFRFANYDSECDEMKDASLKRLELGKGIDKYGEGKTAMRCNADYDKAEEGGFGIGMNHAVKRAGVFTSECYDAEMGGVGIGMNYGVKKAGILKPSYEKAEEGGFGSGRNYGVKRAGIRNNEWDEGLRFRIGDGKWSFGGLERAELHSTNWARGRKRFLSDSCIIDDDYDDYNDDACLTNDDCDVSSSSHENLRLPATPMDGRPLKFERSYSLPGNLDDDYDDYLLEHDDAASRRYSRRSLMDSASCAVKPNRDLLRSYPWRRHFRRSYRRRHPDEVELIMRRGWFDVRRSIRVKVPVSLRARVTDPAVLTGPAHLNTFKVEAIEMPSGAQGVTNSFTLADTADTKVSIRGRTHVEDESSIGRPRGGNEGRKEFGVYELKIPLK